MINKYLKDLIYYTTVNRLSIYDYFYNLAKNYKKNNWKNIENFELENPFLSKKDIENLLTSSDDRMPVFFSEAMTKIFTLNLEKVVKEEKYLKALDIFLEENNLTISEYYEILGNTYLTGKTTSLPEFEKENPFLSKNDIKKLLTSKDDKINYYFTTVMTKVIELNKQKELLDKESQEEVIKEELEKIQLEEQELLDKESQEEVIKEELEKIQLEEEKDWEELPLNNKKIEELNGFAIVKEPLTNKVTAYSYDSKDKTALKNGTILETGEINLESGYYININEYLNTIQENIIENIKNPEKIIITKNNNQTLSYDELTEEIFQAIMASNFIYFGKEFEKEYLNFKDLENTYQGTTSKYYDLELKKGLYIRKDLIENILNNYKIKFLITKNNNENNEAYSYKK